MPRAALSNPNGATSRIARRAPPQRPRPVVAPAALCVDWDGIGPGRRSRASYGRSIRGKLEAVEDCTSRLIVQDERDEIQAATALTGQCVDVVDALQELRPVNTGWMAHERRQARRTWERREPRNAGLAHCTGERELARWTVSRFARPSERGFGALARTCSGIPFVPTLPCGARHRRRFRSSSGTQRSA